MDEPMPPIRAEPPSGGDIPISAIRRSVLPLLGGYQTFGQYWGVWVVVQLDFLRFHDLSAGELGLLFSALSIVSIVTMTLLAPRLQLLPLSISIPLALATMALGALLVALGDAAVLVAGFVVLGVGNGLIDVFLNVAAQAIEAGRRRPVLQWLHASYSMGGITGALGAGLAIQAGVSFRTCLLVSSLALFGSAAWNATSSEVRALPRPAAPATKLSVAVFARGPRLLLPAIVITFAFFVEGSMDVWSGTYLRQTLETNALTAGIAFALFSLALAVGRLTAGRLLFGLGYDRTIQVSGIGAFVGGLVAAATSSPVVVAVAFLFLGFFIASAAPAAFGMADQTEEEPALAVAAMSTIGYTGFVVGPPIMGWLAETSGLRTTMVVIAVSTLGVFVTGVLDRVRHGASARE